MIHRAATFGKRVLNEKVQGCGVRRQGSSGTCFRTVCFNLRKYSQAKSMSPSTAALSVRCRRTSAFQTLSERDG
jgi:hypothetical protein